MYKLLSSVYYNMSLIFIYEYYDIEIYIFINLYIYFS